MNKREKFHELLLSLVDNNSVYFQPPPSFQMMYPCIVYNRIKPNILHANDSAYKKKQGYKVTVIDPNPDSVFLEKINALPFSQFDTHFTNDNLNHDVYIIYY